ncbi:MAG: SDR family oxidoreductase [Gemmatimonadales bacterium]
MTRFAQEGAHVVVADLDGAVADAVAAETAGRFPGRATGVAVDVRDDASIATLFRRSVLEFGGVDCLFYSAGLAPRFAPITEIRREDLQRQLEVHYLGAIAAIGRAAEIMCRQGLGGSIVASVSKAALVPAREAVAYGGSKAALLLALRVAAVELGGDGVRVNAINADQVDTPLFQQFVRERAASRGITVEEQLEIYRKRNLLGAKLIPAEAVADLAVLLASDRFRYTTGDILTVDGGLPEAFPRRPRRSTERGRRALRRSRLGGLSIGEAGYRPAAKQACPRRLRGARRRAAIAPRAARRGPRSNTQEPPCSGRAAAW